MTRSFGVRAASIGLCALSLTAALVVSSGSTALAASAPSTASSADCAPVAAGRDFPPFGRGKCPGVRPGALMLIDGVRCTMNFIFSGEDGHRYVGTAGHCILGAPTRTDQERVWRGRSGATVTDADGRPIGRFAYAILDKQASSVVGSTGLDFALVRLREGVKVNPALCFFGGPTGVNSSTSSDPTLLHWFGNGDVIGSTGVLGFEEQTVPARSGLAATMSDPNNVSATGLAAFGDSGGAVISDDGGAVGILATVGAHVDSSAPDAGSIGIVRLQPVLRHATTALGVALRLQTAPLR